MHSYSSRKVLCQQLWRTYFNEATGATQYLNFNFNQGCYLSFSNPDSPVRGLTLSTISGTECAQGFIYVDARTPHDYLNQVADRMSSLTLSDANVELKDITVTSKGLSFRLMPAGQDLDTLSKASPPVSAGTAVLLQHKHARDQKMHWYAEQIRKSYASLHESFPLRADIETERGTQFYRCLESEHVFNCVAMFSVSNMPVSMSLEDWLNQSTKPYWRQAFRKFMSGYIPFSMKLTQYDDANYILPHIKALKDRLDALTPQASPCFINLNAGNLLIIRDRDLMSTVSGSLEFHFDPCVVTIPNVANLPYVNASAHIQQESGNDLIVLHLEIDSRTVVEQSAAVTFELDEIQSIVDSAYYEMSRFFGPENQLKLTLYHRMNSRRAAWLSGLS